MRRAWALLIIPSIAALTAAEEPRTPAPQNAAPSTSTSTSTSTASGPASSTPPRLAQKQCSIGAQIEALRAGLRRGSPALKRFLRQQLRELAPSVPLAELRAAFERERDPAVIEELSGALAARVGRLEEPESLRAPLDRAQRDPDPEARAAALRGLRGTASVETMGKLGSADYERLVRDPAPAVREAVVTNLLAESAEVYFGHDRAVSEKAIAVALAARSGPSADPAAATRLLSQVSTESVGHQAVTELASLLDGPLDAAGAGLRAAVVTALGGVPSGESAAVIDRLLTHYRKDAAPEVRRAILESLVRLRMAAASPLLDALRPVDRGQESEIAAWQQAIKSGLQEWTLLQREKQRIAQSGQPGPSGSSASSPVP